MKKIESDDRIDPAKIYDRAVRILEAAQRVARSKGHYTNMDSVQLHTDGYAEPGYKDPPSGIVALGNWNDDRGPWNQKKNDPEWSDDLPSRVAELFEQLGIELEWEDEWSDCTACHKLYRISPDSYGWKPSFASVCGEELCVECVKANAEEYLKDLEGNDEQCVSIELDLKKHGYRDLAITFQHGFHEGMDADPKRIGAALKAAGITRYVFKHDTNSQFYIEFSVWVHKSQFAEAKDVRLDRDVADGPSVSGALKKALQGGTR